MLLAHKRQCARAGSCVGRVTECAFAGQLPTETAILGSGAGPCVSSISTLAAQDGPDHGGLRRHALFLGSTMDPKLCSADLRRLG